MSLVDLTIKDEYRSDTCHLIQDFYVPCLEQSILYSRAVGFFSSSSMALAAKGLSALIRSGGKMRLVTSPHLSEADTDAITRGLKNREEVITAYLVDELEQEFEQVVHHRLECLAWLLQTGVLEIRLAIARRTSSGIYHEKLGIFTDDQDNHVVFTGSANESAAALMGNFECVDVFCSWEPALRSRVSNKIQNFQALWDNQTPHLEILEFPEAARRSLLKRCPAQPPTVDEVEQRDAWKSHQRKAPFKSHEPGPSYDPNDKDEEEIHVDSGQDKSPQLPAGLTLRPYQKQAIDSWFANKGRGTLKMATGSGKTITALAIAARLHETCEAQNKPLKMLLVVCPYRHLVTQWAKESRQFGVDPILAFDRMQTWQSDLQTQLLAVMGGRQQFLTVITTNTTLRSNALQSQLQFLPKMTLIIGDEAHNFGSVGSMNTLPNTIPLRLALSATPERSFDEVGTKRIFDYFGPVLQPEFTLEDAIQSGALVPYTYTPILVELTDIEIEQYADLTMRMGKAMSMHGTEDNQLLKILLMERARLLCGAQNKLTALQSLMKHRLNTRHTLFYCGDGSVEGERLTESQRQLDAVIKLLRDRLGYRVEPYVASTTLTERDDLRFAFERGHIQGLAAIRCLDEGVDIPAIQTAVILASSSNPRQFIQRRGRILRQSPDKHQAELFDMVVVPPNLGRKFWATERKVLRGELTRFVEFAKLALNAGAARRILYPLQEKYDLLDL